MASSLLTTREVAEVLGVHPETVLRYVRRGVLPGYRMPGNALRFRADEFELWLSERATSIDAGADV